MSDALFISAAAEAQRRKQEHEEEEKLTSYSPEQLEHHWEFKIVRSSSGAFRKPESLAKLLVEESLAGWVMLEKFDNSRIRFKRALEARSRDHLLPTGYDPYRSTYQMGVPAAGRFLLVVISILLGIGLALAVIGSAMR